MRSWKSIIAGLMLFAFFCAGVAVLRMPPSAELVFRQVREGDRAGLAVNLRSEPGLVGWRDSTGYTPLHWAAAMSDRAAVDLLLAAGADVNARDERGRTPLHAAAVSQTASNEDVIGRLVACGASVDATDDRGATPLKMARAVGRAEAGQSLLVAGAKPPTKDETDTRLAAGTPARGVEDKPPALRRWFRRTVGPRRAAFRINEQRSLPAGVRGEG